MSSLAAARADNFYHPPDYDPSKGSLKKFTGAKGHNQYETDGIIRFELPIDGWCTGCSRHYGKGTRWNAKKLPEGYYFSTRLWSFTMTCHSCPSKIVICTDPKNSDYEYRSGMRKMAEEPTDDSELDSVSAGVQEKLDQLYHKGGHAAEEERQQKQSNTMWKMEREEDSKRRVATEGERFETLVELGETRRLYDSDANAALRQGMRAKRRAAEALVEETTARQLSIPLLEASDADATAARAEFLSEAKRKQRAPPPLRLSNKRMVEVVASSVFGASSSSSYEHKQRVKAALIASSVPLLRASSAALGKFEKAHGLDRGSASSGEAHRLIASTLRNARQPAAPKITKIRKRSRLAVSKQKSPIGRRDEKEEEVEAGKSISLLALTSLYAASDGDDNGGGAE